MGRQRRGATWCRIKAAAECPKQGHHSLEAQQILNEARNHAKDLYMRAYSLKDTDPDEAARMFKQVLDMTPPDDEYHEKAKSRLRKGAE